MSFLRRLRGFFEIDLNRICPPTHSSTNKRPRNERLTNLSSPPWSWNNRCWWRRWRTLTPEELTWQPSPDANPIGWMLWHTLRVEDMWVQFFIQGQIEMWERDGWHEKFGLPTRDNGFGHTPEQVANFPALDLQELLRYGEAVRAGTLEHLRGLSAADFRRGAAGETAQSYGGAGLPATAGRVLPAPGPDCVSEGA